MIDESELRRISREAGLIRRVFERLSLFLIYWIFLIGG
jgi:hypothetical protein